MIVITGDIIINCKCICRLTSCLINFTCFFLFPVYFLMISRSWHISCCNVYCISYVLLIHVLFFLHLLLCERLFVHLWQRHKSNGFKSESDLSLTFIILIWNRLFSINLEIHLGYTFVLLCHDQKHNQELYNDVSVIIRLIKLTVR